MRRCKRRIFGTAVAILVLGVWPGRGAADPTTTGTDDGAIHGRLELLDTGDFSRSGTLASELGAGQADDGGADLRLDWARVFGPWRFEFQDLLTLVAGPEVALARLESPFAAPPPTWLGLTATTPDRGRVQASQTVDRLSVSYTTPDLVIKVGRQALTWGSGLVFRPMDLFDPFSPSALDTEYKPGTDMAYVQKLFADGSDLEFVAAPRPPRAGAGPSADASSLALRYNIRLLGLRTSWMVARDHGDWTGGLGLNGPLGGAVWNLELVPTGLDQGGTRLSALANISDAVTVAGRNATVFAEYFHNGFGALGSGLTYGDLPAALIDRLSRGQIFELRQDYLASGASVELSPLVTAGPTLIVDLNDGSLLALLSASWSVRENLTLVGGVQAPVGAARTEFGGLPLSAQTPLRLAPPTRVYVELRRYF